MSYVNFGSNWHGKENGRNILDIFLKYNIVFAGFESVELADVNIKKYKKDDTIVVTDGYYIKALGIADSDCKRLSDFDYYNDIVSLMKERFSYHEWGFEDRNNIIAMKVKLYKLEDSEYIEYSRFRYPACYISKHTKEIDTLLSKYTGNKILEDNIKLLEQNKNLILTGAPGTGKTHLAKQIASKLCFDKEYSEILGDEDLKKAFDIQCNFVQFHPSYDYTDFVEGLRPVNRDRDNIGFERRDGVFKEFCKRALKNYLDSNKKKSDLSYEAIIKKYLIDFFKHISNTIDNNGKYELIGLSGRPVKPFLSIESNFYDDISNIEENDNDFYIYIGIGTKDKPFIEGDIIEYINWYILFKERLKDNNFNVGNFAREIRRSWVDSYVCAFLLEFDKLYCEKIEQEKNNLVDSVELVERKNFVFIIDEINRGEISKIFGELFFSVDPGYRGEKGKVKTQYQNLIEDDIFDNGFYIPENVYIIGTMNDIDRSVESMDFAMRRRFAWVEINANSTQKMLDIIDDNDIVDELKFKMNNLNDAISNVSELNSSYHIGASYFLKFREYYKKDEVSKESAYIKLWDYHLQGLLFEYLRGIPGENKILENLKESYDKPFKDENVETNN